MKQKSLKLNYILNLIKTVLGIIFPLISYPYVSRVLSVDGLGKINFSSSYANYFILLAAFGVSTFAVREGAKYRDDFEKLGKFATEMLLINIGTALISLLVMGVTLFLPALHIYREIIVVFSLSIIFNTFGMEWYFQLNEEYQYITIRAIVFQILSIIAMFIFVKTREDVLVYACITVCANVGAQILNIFKIRHEIRLFNYNSYDLKKYIKPMTYIFLTLLAMNFYRYIDVTFLGFLKTDRSVGYYSLATKVTNILSSMVSSITVIITPRLAYYHGKGNKKEFFDLAYLSFDFLLLLGIPLSIAVVLLSPTLVAFLGGDAYLPSIDAVRLVSPVILISSLNALLITPILTVMNKEKEVLKLFIIALIFNMISNTIVINIFDFYGAAVITVFTELLICLGALFICNKYFDIKPFFSNVKDYIFGSIGIMICYFIVSHYITSQFLLFIVVTVLGILIYFIILFLLKNKLAWQGLSLIKERIGG